MDILKTRLKSAFNLLDTDPCPKITIDKNTLVTKDGQPVIELLNSFFKCPSPNTPTLSVCSDPSLQNLAKTIKNVCNPLQKEEAEKVDRFGFTEFGKFSFSEPLVHFSVENEKKNSPPPKAVMLQQNKKENTFRQKYAEKQKEELASSLNEMAGSLKETAVSFGHTLSTDSTVKIIINRNLLSKYFIKNYK